MKPEPIAVIDGLEIEIRHRKMFLVLTPIPSEAYNFKPTKDAESEGMLQMINLMNNLGRLPGQIVLVYQKADSTIGVVSPVEVKEEIESRTISVSQLKKYPIYQDDMN